MPPKRYCKFSDDLKKQYPYFKKTKLDSEVECEKCHRTFSIAYGGSRDIRRHIESDKHKAVVQAAASSSQMLDFFQTKEFEEKEKDKDIAWAEAVYSFHTVCHNQSYRSMDCTSKLVQKFFNKKFSCARTKCEAIINNVIAPHISSEVKSDLEQANFVSIYSDASNHKDVKLFPTLVRYFNPVTGVNVKMLDLVTLPGETSQMISNSLLDILRKNELQKKVVAYCADNANTNFGGSKRRGENNIFSKINKNLAIENKIIGVGCTAHILHNTIQTAADLLPIDIQSVVHKIYYYFNIYTVRVERLKRFCQEAEVEYQKLLGYSKTRWLALLPALERILKLFEPLKAYFLSSEKCPTLIENFFKNETSEIWLLFLHNQYSLFSDVIKKIEATNISLVETLEELQRLQIKLEERANNLFLPFAVKNNLNTLVENGHIDETWFKSQVKCFYANCVKYLQDWSNNFSLGKTVSWITLKKPIESADIILESLQVIIQHTKIGIIDENCLFDEITFLKRYVTQEKVLQWKNSSIKTDLRWIEIFKHFNEEEIPYLNLLKVVEFALCLPGTNAATERIFSMINKIWTIEKTELSILSLKSIIIVKSDGSSCEEFSRRIKENNELLRKVHSTQKYT